MSIAPTVCVKREGGRGYHLINESDFDPKVHQRVEAPKSEPDDAALADPLNVPSASEEAVAESAGAPKQPARKGKAK